MQQQQQQPDNECSNPNSNSDSDTSSLSSVGSLLPPPMTNDTNNTDNTKDTNDNNDNNDANNTTSLTASALPQKHKTRTRKRTPTLSHARTTTTTRRHTPAMPRCGKRIRHGTESDSEAEAGAEAGAEFHTEADLYLDLDLDSDTKTNAHAIIAETLGVLDNNKPCVSRTQPARHRAEKFPRLPFPHMRFLPNVFATSRSIYRGRLSSGDALPPGYPTVYTDTVSAWSGRLLNGYIGRDFDASSAPQARLLAALHARFARPSKDVVCAHSVDFVHLARRHLLQVNALLERQFWPGIDVSEYLFHADHSYVALHGALVVGCILGTPGGYLSYFAVLPAWQRASIGSVLLYALIGSYNRDIVLHVSVTNPAMLMYQSFGFKVEEYVIGFYDRFFPASSQESRNAFYMRLQRFKKSPFMRHPLDRHATANELLAAEWFFPKFDAEKHS